MQRVIGLDSVQNQTNSLCKLMFVLNREPPELKVRTPMLSDGDSHDT